MMTWIKELKEKVEATGDLKLYEAYEIAGWGCAPTSVAFNNMIKALSMHPWLNNAAEKRRLAAAKYIKANYRKVK